MNAYPVYKESGFDWVGEIPSHWKVTRVKFLSHGNVEYGININSDAYSETGIRFIRTTDIDDNGNLTSEGVYLSSEVVDDSCLLKDGDFIISRSGTIGRAYVYKSNGEDACYAGYLVRFKFYDNQTAQFVYWFTKSGLFQIWLDHNRIESTISNVNGQKYANLSIGVPISKEEIAGINNFLDRKTAQIDILIEKKQRQIELLQEQRIALINQAVTKGLDSCVPMKDSGIEWLGEIPAHWTLRRNGTLFDQRDERNFPELPLLNVSIHTGVTLREFSSDHVEQMASDWSTYKKAEKGDISFNKMRMWQGAVGVAPVTGLVSPDYTVAKPRTDVNPFYFETLFRTHGYKVEINRNSRGIVPDRNRLYWDQFKQIYSTYPPIDEQNEIVEFVIIERGKIDLANERFSKEIELLQEYRTALISSAVTGKIDVRRA